MNSASKPSKITSAPEAPPTNESPWQVTGKCVRRGPDLNAVAYEICLREPIEWVHEEENLAIDDETAAEVTTMIVDQITRELIPLVQRAVIAAQGQECPASKIEEGARRARVKRGALDKTLLNHYRGELRGRFAQTLERDRRDRPGCLPALATAMFEVMSDMLTSFVGLDLAVEALRRIMIDVEIEHGRQGLPPPDWAIRADESRPVTGRIISVGSRENPRDIAVLEQMTGQRAPKPAHKGRLFMQQHLDGKPGW